MRSYIRFKFLAMKKIILPFLFILVLFSCKKEEEPDYSTDRTMTAKLEGNLWRAVTPEGGVSNGFYIISGESKIGHKINLYMTSVYEGEFILAPTSTSLAEYISADENDGVYTTQNADGTSGKIIIKSLNKANHTATGTFYFKANKIGTHYTKTISSGEFTDMPYSDLAPDPSNNVMTAKTNNNQWVGTSVTASAFTTSNQLKLTGTDGLETLELIMPANVVNGTYAIDGTTYSGGYTQGTEGFAVVAGSITVTSNNTSTKTLTGSFSMETQKLSDTSIEVSITEGTFSVVYTTYN